MKDKIIKLARDEIGYLEKSKSDYSLYGSDCLYPKKQFAGADNYTKYAYELRAALPGSHAQGQPWCMSFICWIFYTVAGSKLANQLLCGMLRSASTMDTKNAMIKAGRQVPLNTAQPGDIVFRSRLGGGHVGLVEGRSSDGKIITIEGNTSANDASAWNGGAVARHTGGSWEWCCRPDWSLCEGDWHWVHENGLWYYQDSAGNNWHGWNKIKESNGDKWHWYWFDWDGSAATGSRFIDGKWWFFWPDRDSNECMLCITDSTGALVVWSLTE